jgi:putative membrane-bound dehydrogenase-like protein
MAIRMPLLAGLLILSASPGTEADSKRGLRPGDPLSPKEELATIRVPRGFRVELVACEPNVVDPVAIAFDENGRLFVAEMRGYPNEGVATGSSTSGIIKLLEDRDGDGFFESSTIFADNLRFPTSVMPWNGGLLVADAPKILFLEDTKNTGKADRHRILYDGFTLANIQQLINSLQWGMDNWVYGCAGGSGGTIRSVEKPDRPPVTLHGRGVRFHPEQPGNLEPMSGGGQFGLASDDWQNWFTATNSQHLRQIVLPDHYLRRNLLLPVSAVTIDIPDHGPACKVYRISPFEGWRVERTKRRSQGPDARRFPATELVPGGYVTSACSPMVYTADLYPEPFRGNTFVCDPANNLVHRDRLVPNGLVFTAQRADVDCEFFASTDTWCRPVNLTVGPDGALYVVDFYREVIETPLSLPEDIKKKVNLESRGRGRIWRIVPEGKTIAKKPQLRGASIPDLVRHLNDGNSWWRLTAQRMLVERQDKTAVSHLVRLAEEGTRPQGRAHALWTLDGLTALPEDLITQALQDPVAGVRQQALRLAETQRAWSVKLQAAVAGLADDPSPGVRFQLAFTLGEADSPELLTALAKLARRTDADPWTPVAVLSSASKTAPALLKMLVQDKVFIRNPTTAQLDFLSRLAALIAARPEEARLAELLNILGESQDGSAKWQTAILEGLAQGLKNSQRSLSKMWDQPPASLNQVIDKILPYFVKAAATAGDDRRAHEDRISAIRLLASGPPSMTLQTLPSLLGPKNPQEIQLAAVRSLAHLESPQVATVLLTPWNSFSPIVRREVLEAVFASPHRISVLLDAVEKKELSANQIEPARLDQLRTHNNAALRARAQKLLAGHVSADRRKILEDYQSVLDLKADAGRGKMVFKKNCATCHRLENEGVEVGPDLLSALRNKTREGLLIDILDPSREVDPRYINYLVSTKAGKVLSGMIVTETASSITLRRAEKAEDTILRSQIDEIQAAAKSIMPEGLEMQISKQEMADLIAFLRRVAETK